MSKKVFVSFKYNDDKHYKYLLEAWSQNENVEFLFDDNSSGEIQSNNIDVIKRALSRKINSSSVTLVILGKSTHKKDPNSLEIGYDNWQIYEIEKSKEHKNSMIVVKLSRDYISPDQLKNCGVSWVYSFNQKTIMDALNDV